jgi:hypothetical protein
MIQNDITYGNPTLDFTPLKSTPNFFPLFTWGDLPINISNKDNGIPSLDLKERGVSLADAISQIYPSLSFIEISQFFNIYESLIEFEIWLEVFNKFNLRLNESLILLMKSLTKTPKAFRVWCSEKYLGPRDLEILRSSTVSDLEFQLLTRISELNPTKSTGAEILELTFELVGLGLSPKLILESLKDNNIEDSVYKLRKLRHPLTTQIDSLNNQKLKSIPSINGVDVQWKRYNDRSGVELKIFATSSSEFQKKMNSIQKWQSNYDGNIWT